MKTITVTGTGTLSVVPDTVRIVMTIKEKQKEYDDTIEKSAKMTGQLKDSLRTLGFEKKDIKTLSFNINTEYESYHNEENIWKQRLVGYTFIHRMKLEFSSDSQLTGKVLYILGHSELTPEFSIEYTVSDPEKSKNELLKKAVSDSKKKAGVIAKAAGVSLGDILSINYSWTDIELVSRPVNSMLLSCSAMKRTEEEVAIDIEPDEIRVTDSVTVVWGME